jgi:glutamate-1-semialdehyde 2,1-aminomutase
VALIANNWKGAVTQAMSGRTVQADYEEKFAGSFAQATKARQVIAGGIAHDGRYSKPFPLYVERADGAHKWDVDGHEIIDFAIGHGALILGHNDPDVAAAVMEQYPKGTHYGACHEAEIKWGEQVQRLIPSAELVRFTSSGTESTMLAIRLARAFQGKSKVLKLEGHFHGWHDYLIKGEKPPFDAPSLPGVPAETYGTVDVIPANDAALVAERLATGEYAALIMEPSGSSWSTIPLAADYLAEVRRLTTEHNVTLIFDEVITGFRWAPGGAQERFNIIPDMTTLAKIVAGGMPGGAVAGKREIMELLEFRDDPVWMSTKKVGHPGTYNANPLAAAAGAAALEKCANPAVQAHCDNLAAQLRAGMNAILVEEGVPGAVWGESSAFHIMVGTEVTNLAATDMHRPEGVPASVLKASGKAGLGGTVHLAMLIEGVDLFSGGGLFSTAHTQADVDRTIDAFDRVITRFKKDGLV